MDYLPQDPLIRVRVTPGSPEWLRMRADYFTGSDTATVMGISPYVSRAEFLRADIEGRPREIPEFVKNTILAHGETTEKEAREAYERETGNIVFPAVFTRGPWWATPDGVVLDGPEIPVRGVEIKCPYKRRASRRWEAACEGVILPHDRAQLAVQYAVIQCPIDFYVYVPGNPPSAKMITYTGPSREEWAAIVGAWEQYTADLANAKSGDNTPAGWGDAAARFLAAQAELEAATQAHEKARADLIALSGGRDISQCGVRVTHVQRKGNIDWQAAFRAIAPPGYDVESFRKEPTATVVVAISKENQ